MHSPVSVKHALIAGLILLSQGLTPAWAAVYQWVDDKGITHFSETPPLQRKWELATPSYTKPNNPEAAEQRLQRMLEQQKISQETRTTRKQEAQDKAAATKQRKQNCTNAKKRLETLQARPRLLLQKNDGTVTRLTEEQRQERIQRGKERVSEFCQ